MLDEKVLRMEKILKTMIVKLMKEAQESETERSVSEYSIYKRAVLERSKIDEYTFTFNEIARLIPRLSFEEAKQISEDVLNAYKILEPKEIERVLHFKRMSVIENYVEFNEYYRKIMGLPPIKHTVEDFIKVGDQCIHELSIGDINALRYSGELDLIIVKYQDNPEYDYLRYLGKGISVWMAHESGLYEILYMDNNEESTQYRSFYNQERKVFLRTYSSKHLNKNTDYNEAYELNFIKFMALSNMEMNKYSPSLNKDSFTVEEAISKWKEFGLVFPKDMPASYRNSTTFLLNYLSLFKGTNYVLEFITKRLFSGLNLFKYYIYKKVKSGVKFPVDPDTPPWEVYDVEFLQVPFDGFYTDYLDDENKKILTYQDIVDRDPKWQNTEELKRAVFTEEFSFVESKYLGMNFYVDLNRFSADFSTMINIFLNQKDKLEKILIYYPTNGTNESFYNLFVYFLALFGFLITKTKVTDPNTMEKYRDGYVYGFHVPEDVESFRVKFIKFFFNTPFRHLLNDFPKKIEDYDDFFTAVEKADKQVRFVENFDNLIPYCKSHEDYLFLNNFIRLVTLIKTNPELFELTDYLPDGLTYEKYLKEHAPNLYASFTYLLSLNIEQNFVMEFDTVVQLLIDALDRDTKDNETLVGKLQSLLSDSSVFINGVNKYLIYILKLFKSYSSDFLTEDADYNLTPEGNFSMQLDEMYFHVDIELEEKRNNTQIDKINIVKQPPHFSSTSLFKDSIIFNTPYGDVELETK